MRRVSPFLLCAAFGLLQIAMAPNAFADPILGTAGNFAVLAGSATTNTGSTTITGDYGVYAGTSLDLTGVTLTVPSAPHATDAVAQQAQKDLTTAYLSLQALLPTTNLTGQNLGGMTLTSGVYKFDSSAFLTGTSASPGILTLDAQGLDNQFFVFQIGTTLNTSSADTGSMTSAKVQIENPGANDGVYWVVGSAATIGTYTQFEGNILSLAQIALETGATIDCGRALNQTPGPVTMDTNTISIGCTGVTGESSSGLSGSLAFAPGSPGVPNVPGAFLIAAGAGGPVLGAVPEPGTFVLFGSAIAWLAVRMSRSARGRQRDPARKA